jgi:hypothetical protein
MPIPSRFQSTAPARTHVSRSLREPTPLGKQLPTLAADLERGPAPTEFQHRPQSQSSRPNSSSLRSAKQRFPFRVIRFVAFLCCCVMDYTEAGSGMKVMQSLPSDGGTGAPTRNDNGSLPGPTAAATITPGWTLRGLPFLDNSVSQACRAPARAQLCIGRRGCLARQLRPGCVRRTFIEKTERFPATCWTTRSGVKGRSRDRFFPGATHPQKRKSNSYLMLRSGFGKHSVNLS